MDIVVIITIHSLYRYYYYESLFATTMPSPLRNGDAAHPRLPSPAAATPLHHYNHNHNHNYPSFRSTVSEQKIRRLNLLILLLRLAAFCFSLSAAVFTAANSSRSASSPYSWLSVDSFR